jgi:hypothetical protein
MDFDVPDGNLKNVGFESSWTLDPARRDFKQGTEAAEQAHEENPTHMTE